MKAVTDILIIICLGLFDCHGRILRWVPDTDFENSLNWRTGHLPCHNEHVRFPPTTVSVFIQRNNTVLEIVLPNDGEIVLGEDVSITLLSAPDSDATCVEQDTFYNGSNPASWYDVRNWCEADDNDMCKSNIPRRLHTAGIPCVYDDVVFALDSRFVVGIHSGADIHVNTVRIGYQRFTTSDLLERMNSDAGHRQFVRSSTGVDTTISVDGNRCDDIAGCACNNNQLKEKVCAIESARCNIPSCDDPIMPQQHCCAICGAVLKLHYSSGFRIDAIERILSTIYQPPRNVESIDGIGDINVVWWIVSKVGSDSETAIQVVIADDKDGASAKVVAYDVKKLLEDDMKENRRLGVTMLTMDVSGASHPSAHSHTGELSPVTSTGVIVVIVIAVIIILLAIAGAVVCYVWRRQGKRMPTISMPQFMRWRLRGGRTTGDLGDMELGRRGVVFDNRVIFDVSGTSFDNLTFGNQPRHGLEQLETQPRIATEAGFDNPMYGTGALHESSDVSSAGVAVAQHAQPTYSTPTTSRLDCMPLVSRMAGMLRGLRFNVATQKVEEAPINAMGTGNDVNDNEKPYDTSRIPAKPGYDVPSTATEGKSTKKKRSSGKTKTSERKEGEAVDKHHKMEEDSTDSEKDLAGKTARKLATQMSEKGFGNPCYELGPIDLPPVTLATAMPKSAAAATIDSYRTGFANPMFEETERMEVTLEDARTGDNDA